MAKICSAGVFAPPPKLSAQDPPWIGLTDANLQGHICPGNIYVMVTFVNISNISAVTDLIFTKLLGPNFLGALIFLGQNLFLLKYSFGRNIFFSQIFLPTIFCTQNFLDQNFFEPHFCVTQNHGTFFF